LAIFLTLWIVSATCSCLQSELWPMPGSSPSPSPSATPSPIASPSLTPTPDDHFMREGIKGIVEDSKTLTTWGLTLIGASIAAIVSTGYFRPVRTKIRTIYLLFIPGWLFIALSIYVGDKISRRSAAAAFNQTYEALKKTGNLINADFDCQLTFFHTGLIFFSMWLLAFILWWVFGRPANQQMSTSDQDPAHGKAARDETTVKNNPTGG